MDARFGCSHHDMRAVRCPYLRMSCPIRHSLHLPLLLIFAIGGCDGSGEGASGGAGGSIVDSGSTDAASGGDSIATDALPDVTGNDASETDATGNDASDAAEDGSVVDGDATDAGAEAGPPPVLPRAGCGTTGVATGSIEGLTTSVNGADRSYDIFVPVPYDEAKPHALIFSYHGVGGTANTNQFRIDNYSKTNGGYSINVAPQGWGTAEWPEAHFVPFAFDDSVVVFDQIIDELAAAYCIDLNRVFVIGNSNGGQMAFHLGCVRGDRIRAVIPNGGRCEAWGDGVCDPYHPPSAQSCVGEVMVLSVMGEGRRHAARCRGGNGRRLSLAPGL